MTGRDSNFDEKRRERRFPINSTVTLTDAEGNKIVGTCCNISGSGLLVKSDDACEIGQVLHIQIQEGKIDFQADAEVVRLVKEGEDTLIGLKVNKQIS